MDQAGSKQAPPVASARGKYGGPKARQPDSFSRRSMRGYKYYQDHDLVSNRLRALDYDDYDDPEPDPRDDLMSCPKRYESQDGYHRVVHGLDNKDIGIKTEPAPSPQETLDEARRGKAAQSQSLPQSRKRATGSDNSRQTSAKKQRTWTDRRNRLCLDCGKYHSSPCYVPHCRLCDTKHHDTILCQDAMKKLRERMMLYGPFVSFPSPKKKETNKTQSSLSALRAPASLHKTASDSPIVKKDKKHSPNSNSKRSCPLCRECGRFHRSVCKWLVCSKCPVKHHPEVACTVAEERLQRRLEEEDVKQTQSFLEKGDRKRNLNMKNVRDKLAASCLEVAEMQRLLALNPDKLSGTDTAPRETVPKKGTRFCRDCGRYLSRACEWPTCGACNSKHFEHIPCHQARRALQSRLDTFDRTHGASQQKSVDLNERWLHTTLPPSPLKQVEYVGTTARINSAALTPMVARNVQPNTNFPFDGNMPWFVDSKNIIRFGSAPDGSNLTGSPPSMPEQQNGLANPPLKPIETASLNIPQPLLQSILSRNPWLTLNTPTPPAHTSAANPSLEKSIDDLLLEAQMNARANHANVTESVGDTQQRPSYFGYMRGNGRQ